MNFTPIVSDLNLPNSVMFHNGKILITEGGCDRLVTYDASSLERIGTFGSFGKGKHKFREPVNAIYLVTGDIAVCDWHNHRVVFFDQNFKYKCELGQFGDENSSSLLNALKRFRYSHASLGTYLDDKGNSARAFANVRSLLGRKICQSLKSIHYDIFVRDKVVETSSLLFNKPNGIFATSTKLAITVKNSKKVVVISLETCRILIEIKHNEFGRLGQGCFLTESQILFCDETNRCLWHFDLIDGQIAKVPLDMRRPFSVVSDEKRIIIAGGNEILFCDHNFNTLCKKILSGEFHGLCLGQKSIYLLDRENGKLLWSELDDEFE